MSAHALKIGNLTNSSNKEENYRNRDSRCEASAGSQYYSHMTEFAQSDAGGAPDPQLAAFVLLARFLGVPAEPDQIHHDRGTDPYDFDQLVRIAKRLHLGARRKRPGFAELARLPLPALVALDDGGAALLLKVDESGDLGARYMVLTPERERPQVLST